jgi:hypothetical protein
VEKLNNKRQLKVNNNNNNNNNINYICIKRPEGIKVYHVRCVWNFTNCKHYEEIIIK